MRKSFIVPFGIVCISASLLLSACQPQPQAVGGKDQVEPTGTGQPGESTKTPIPFIYPTETVPPPAPTEESGLSVVWTFETGGAVWATPAVVSGVAYIGSDDGSLYAVDARTGQMQWKFDTGGIVRSTPSIAEGSAFIASDDGNVYAVNIQDGTQIWKTDIGNAFPREEREVLGNSPSPTGYDYRQSSPVFANGLVYVGSYDGNVYALAANDGKVIWTFKTGEKVRATPTIVNDVVYIGSWDKKSYALEASTGKLLWETPVYGQVQTTALVVDDLVITASRKASVQALNIDTGELVWEFEYGPNNWVESSPTLAGDKIVIGSSGARRVIALDYKTGKIFWSFSSEAFNWSTPLPVGNTVYIGGAAYQNPAKGALFVLKVSDQVVHPTIDRRIFSILETLEPSGEVNGVAGSPVIVDGILYFGALDGRLYAVRD